MRKVCSEDSIPALLWQGWGWGVGGDNVDSGCVVGEGEDRRGQLAWKLLQ